MPKSDLQGQLLVAKPSILGDPSFHRAVVLLAQKNSESTLGFILNKPLDITLNTLLPEIETSFPVFYGGPVDPDNLFYIHNQGDHIQNSISIDDHWYWGGDFEDVVSKIQTQQLHPENIRFFMGYSGWAKDQLEDEMNSESWLVVSLPKENILTMDPHAIWPKILYSLGGEYQVWANFPDNPNYN